MKIVVIGASGHIGTYLVPMLVDAGYEVTAITRGLAEPYEFNPAWKKANPMHMDRTKEPEFAKKIADMQADAVVDLINFDVADTRAMVEALKDTKCSHYLYCSSCWTHGRAQVLPVDPDDYLRKEPLDAYGKDKYASELYLKEQYRTQGFPATIIMPGQISGAGWKIIGPWANLMLDPFQKIANGETVFLPNFGMETIHHVHGYDVAQCFFKAITHRIQSLGESFDAASGGSITLYGYARLLYDFFGKQPKIEFLSWKEWCEYVDNPYECEQSYLHMARSGSYSVEKGERLLEYRPRYTNVDTIKLAVQSYVDRGLVTIDR